jgi:hypothetical protein
MTTAIRFTAYTDSTAGPLACWPWTGARNEHGYGLLRVDDRLEKAPRVALALDGRPVPPDMQACHECDNPACVNPKHLYVGTHRDNADDMLARGRPNRGEKNGQARLTQERADAMRKDRATGWNYDELVAKYGVSKSTVSRVINRKNW